MDCIEFQLEVAPGDVDCDEFDGYEIKSLAVDHDQKKIISAHYTYSWVCGDGCCSDTEIGECYAVHLSQWVKNLIAEKLPGYSFEC